MKDTNAYSLKVLLLGIASWAIPFFVSFVFFNSSGELQIAQPLFKSLMVVIGGGAGALLLIIAFRRVAPLFRTGLTIGIFWLAINWGLDVVILIPLSGMGMAEYFYDIGLRYLMLPIMAAAMGIVAENTVITHKNS